MKTNMKKRVLCVVLTLIMSILSVSMDTYAIQAHAEENESLDLSRDVDEVYESNDMSVVNSDLEGNSITGETEWHEDLYPLDILIIDPEMPDFDSDLEINADSENTPDEESDMSDENISEDEYYMGQDIILSNENEDYSYSLQDDVITITKYSGSEENINIPSVLDGYSVVAIGASAFKGNKIAKSISIPDSVLTIGTYAFQNCTSLETVLLPETLVSIGGNAFSSATSLTELTIPSSVTSIGNNAFYNSVQKITFAEGFTEIIDNACYGASLLETVVFPDEISRIGSHAFYQCKKLKNIQFTSDLESIGDYAFYQCTALENISLPESLVTIDKYAFASASSLTELVIPSSVTNLGNNAFNNSVQKITFAEGFTEIMNNACYGASALETVILPNGIKKIGDHAFYQCKKLKNIQFTSDLESIGDHAFYQCSSLENINLPESLVTIDKYAFASATSLTELTIPSNVTNIGSYAFSNSVKKIIFADGFSEIMNNACYGASLIETVALPDSVKILGEKAFYGCKKLSFINLPKGLKTIKKGAFYDCPELESISIPMNVETIEQSVFYNSVKMVVFEEGTINIPDHACDGATNLQSVGLPDSIKSIGVRAFYGCKQLNGFIIPEGTTKIGNSAFYGNVDLRVYVPSTLTDIGENAFSGCILCKTCGAGSEWELNMEENFALISGNGEIENGNNDIFVPFSDEVKFVKIEEGITAIGDHSFENMDQLVEIVMGDSVKEIGFRAFYNCDYLKRIELSEDLEDIKASAFQDCPSIDTLIFSGNFPRIDSSAFTNNQGLSSIDSVGSNLQQNNKPTAYFPQNNNTFSEINRNQMPDYVWKFYDNTLPERDILLVLDVSGSMSGSRIDSLKEAVIAFSRQIGGRLTNTRIGVVTYASDAKKLMSDDFSSMIERIEDRVSMLNAGGDTYYLKGLAEAEEMLKSSPAKVKSVILFSDGAPSDNRNSIVDKAVEFRYLGYYVYSVGLEPTDTNRQLLIDLAGDEDRYFEADDVVSLVEKFVQLSDGVGRSGLCQKNLIWKYDSYSNQLIISRRSVVDGKGIMIDFSDDNLPKWNDYSESLQRILIDSEVTYIGKNAFSKLTNISEVTIDKSVTEIGAGAFSGCTKLVNVYYNGTKEEWDKIHIGDNNTFLTKANLICKGINHDDLKDVTIKLGFEGEKNIGFGPSLFADSSETYSPELSNLAICLSTMVYETDNTDEDKEHERMGNNFLKLEFNKEDSIREFVRNHYFPDYTGHSTNQANQGDNSPFWIVDKKIRLGEEDYNLIMVVIRGTYDTEWIDNFDSGTGDTHMGFERAAVNVVNNLNNYIGMNDIKGNIKILITGHSRGAAVANLVGKKLDDGEVPRLSSINRNDVFVYTYATPNVTSKSNRSNSKYNNIFNILNPEDFVTKVLPAKWGYGRYGINYVLPSSTFYPGGFKGINENYSKYSYFVDDVSKKTQKYRPTATEYKKYDPYDNGMKGVSDYVGIIMLYVPNIKMYYAYPLRLDLNINSFNKSPYTKSGKFTVYSSLYSLFRHFLAYNRTHNYEAQSYVTMVQAVQGAWGIVGLATDAFFIYNGKITPQFGCAHTPETYMAMLELTPLEILKAPKFFSKVVVNCPVDVIVKDGNGNIIGKTVQDTVQSTTNELALSVEGESKTLLIPEGADYTLELTGNDTGTMDYSIVKYDADTGEVGRDIYLDLPLSKGTKYTQDLEGYNDAGDAPLLDGNSNVVKKTLSLKGDELGALSVKVKVEGDGSALGYENVTPGDYVTLQAYTNEFNEFLGWYDANGNLISKDAEYGFSVQKNEEFTAKFTSNDEGLWVESIAPVKYSGSVQKPNVNVYDGYTELIEKKDYTLTYKNNKEVYTLSENDPGFDPKKAPNVTITGKGNYSSKEVVYFKILPQDIGDYEFSADDITMSYTGKKQKIKPVLYWNSKTLANGKEYRFDIYRASDVEFKQPLGDTIIEEGDYVIRYAGKGNFIGTRNCTLSIRKDIKLVNKLKIGKISNQKYTGKVIRPEPEVKDGNVLLEKDKHYTLSYASNENIGTGYVIVSGIPENGYSGSKRISFKITGTKATSYDISTAKDTEKRITVVCDKNTPFKKGGAKPSVVVTFKDTDGSVSTLVEQKDYKLSYKNNTTFNTKNAPAVIITGMGRFKGKREETFAIRETGLNTSILIADDKPFNTKPNKYTTKVTLVDEDGKNLSAGKDYDKDLNYTYLKDTKVTVNGSEVNRLAGSKVEKTDVIPVDTVIKVKAVAKAGSGYTGTVSGTYKIMTASIASAKVTVPAQTYTGKPIVLAKDKITVSIKGQRLNANDYEIVGYSNNVAKGTAKVTIRGIGNYGGLKTQSFTIKAKGLTWWKKLKKALAN